MADIIRELIEVIKKTINDEVKVNICKTVREIFEEAKKDPAVVEGLKTDFIGTLKKVFDKILESDELKVSSDAETTPQSDDDKKKADIPSPSHGGSRKKTRKLRKHIRTTPKTHRSCKHKRVSHTNKMKAKGKSKTKGRPKTKAFKSAIFTSVERKCVCTDPQKCVCEESHETIRDPPTGSMTGGSPIEGGSVCEGAA